MGPPSSSTFRQYLATISCTLSVVMTAASFVWMEPIIIKMKQGNSEIVLTSDESSWIIASIEFGEIFTTITAGILADKWGRKWTLLSTGPMIIVSWLIVIFTRSKEILYLIRFIQGVALGIVYTVAPIYIAEISEPRIRGELSGHVQTAWYVGILFIYATGPYLSYNHYALACASLPVLFLVTYYLMPESPYYFLMKDKPEKALESLQWFRGSGNVDNEFKSIQISVEEEMKNTGGWRDLIATKKDRKALIIVQVVCFIRNLSGLSAFINYATETFSEGSMSLNHDQLTICMGALLTVATFVSAFFSDSVGRRPLLIASTFGCAFFNSVMAAYYYFDQVAGLDLCPYQWIAYVSIAGFCIISSVGLGPLVQTLQAEFFSAATRGIGGGVTAFSATVSSFISIKLYQVVTDAVGIYMNFVLFALSSLVGTIILLIFLPETAGKSLGDIQKDLSENNERENNN